MSKPLDHLSGWFEFFPKKHSSTKLKDLQKTWLSGADFWSSILCDYTDKILLEQTVDQKQHILMLTICSDKATLIACRKSWIRANAFTSTLRFRLGRGHNGFTFAVNSLNRHLLINILDIAFENLTCAPEHSTSFTKIWSKIVVDLILQTIQKHDWIGLNLWQYQKICHFVRQRFWWTMLMRLNHPNEIGQTQSGTIAKQRVRSFYAALLK